MEEGLLQGGPDYVSLIADGEDWCVPCLPVAACSHMWRLCTRHARPPARRHSCWQLAVVGAELCIRT